LARILVSKSNEAQAMPTENRFIPLPEVRARTTLSRSEIYRRISLGVFPTPVPLGGGRRVAWLESDVATWIADRLAAAKAEGGR
jgi:prophage regulatory protein